MLLEEILTILRGWAPEESALHDDPVGLLIGSERQEVHKVGVCLDAMPDAAQRAVASGAHLVIAHHPLIYRPLKTINPATNAVARAVTALIKGDIALYAMHTNWDRAAGGINDTLAGVLDLQDIRPLGSDGERSLPRIGHLEKPMAPADFSEWVSEKLGCSGISALRVNDLPPDRLVSCVAVCGGAGAFLADAAQAAGADAYVTSDVRHHEFLDAAAQNLILLDAGHQATETPGMQALRQRLSAHLPEIEVVWVGD